ncbi:hypothetical protein AB0C77_23850, partial [Streptomyces sp. NPDC048629]
MNFDDRRPHPRIQHVTVAGTALAAAVLPLVVGVLLAKAAATDPMTSVNALITNGAHRPRISPATRYFCTSRTAMGWTRLPTQLGVTMTGSRS